MVDSPAFPVPSIRVVLAAQQAFLRRALRDVLAREADLTVVGEATDAATALAACQQGQPDVADGSDNSPHPERGGEERPRSHYESYVCAWKFDGCLGSRARHAAPIQNRRCPRTYQRMLSQPTRHAKPPSFSAPC
jgi:hypothetical protein